MVKTENALCELGQEYASYLEKVLYKTDDVLLDYQENTLLI